MCPAPTAPSPPAGKLHGLSVSDVATFVSSIGPSGSRQVCPPGCPLIEYFNASRFVERGITGGMLARLVRAHDAREWVHNNTLRAAHAEWLAAHGLPETLKAEQRLAMMTRLRDALRHAGLAVASEPQRRLVQLQRLRARGAQHEHERRRLRHAGGYR